MFTVNCIGYKASDEERHGNYRRRFGSKWLWFILKLHFGIIMEEMRKTNTHFNQKGSCPSGRDVIRVPPEQHTVTDCDGSPALTTDDRCRIYDSRNLF